MLMRLTLVTSDFLEISDVLAKVRQERRLVEIDSTYRTNQITNLATRVQVRDC